MEKYVIVPNTNIPFADGCKYLSSVDKDGMQFSDDVDDAIVFNDRDRCVFFALGISVFQLVDVYRLAEKVVRTYDYIW